MIKFLPFYLLLTFFSCSEPIEKLRADPFDGMTKKERKSALESALTRSSRKEQKQILGYLKRHQITAIKTETGIHYCIYEKGNGNLIDDGQIVIRVTKKTKSSLEGVIEIGGELRSNQGVAFPDTSLSVSSLTKITSTWSI